jgi:hypothetical protein
MALAGLTLLTTGLSAHAQTQVPDAESPFPAAGNASSADRSSSDLDVATRLSWSDDSPGPLGTNDHANTPQPPVVPEPQAVLLLAGGAVLLAMKRSRAN